MRTGLSLSNDLGENAGGKMRLGSTKDQVTMRNSSIEKETEDLSLTHCLVPLNSALPRD